MNLEERNKRVERNLKLVSHALTLLKVPWNEDYFQQGVLELIRCAENYDETKGYKFSTYATKCIMLKLKDYIKRDYVIKPKLTGEKGGKVYAPPVTSLTTIVHELPGDKPIMLQDMIADDLDWEAIDLKLELQNIIEEGLLTEAELQLFIDAKINQYSIKELSKKYRVTNKVVREIILRTKTILKENISYNYYEGGH